MDRGSEIGRIVIAVEADVQAAERNFDALDLLDLLGELLCQKVAARDDRCARESRARCGSSLD